MKENKFVYLYYTENDEIFDYSVIDLTMYSSYNKEFKNDVFSLVYGFYSYKINKNRMNIKTSKIKQVINNNIKRLSKKLNIWDIQLDECNKKISSNFMENFFLPIHIEKMQLIILLLTIIMTEAK